MPSLPVSRRAIAAYCALGLIGCAPKDQADQAASAAAQDSRDSASATAPAARVSSVGNFKTPESVRYDADMDAFFVSNINGNPSQKDNNGFLSRVMAATDSATVVVEGGKGGVTLNAPKGIAIVADTLWVADIDAVRGFNKKTGAVVASIDLAPSQASFLNDIAVGPDGSLYVTDTGIHFDAQGAMTHPGKDRIFRIGTDRKVTVALAGDSLGAPNGITYDRANDRFIIAPFSSPAIMSWKPGDAKPTQLATGPGGYDGIEVLGDGRVLVSSWTDSSVHVMTGATLPKLISGVEAPADIGVDTKRGRVAIPRFNANEVELWTVGGK